MTLRSGSGQPALARIPKPNGAALSIPFTPEISFAIWRGLPAQTQLALLGKLAEAE